MDPLLSSFFFWKSLTSPYCIGQTGSLYCKNIFRQNFLDEKDLLEAWTSENQRARFEELKDVFHDGPIEKLTNGPPKQKKFRKKKQNTGKVFSRVLRPYRLS